MWRIIISVLFLALSSGTLAVTVTFDDIESGFVADPVYTEDGITVTSGGGDLGYFGDEGTVHLNDFGTSFTSSIIVTTNSYFSAESVEILGAVETRLFYELADSSDPTGSGFVSGSIPTGNVLVRGYRGESLVAEDRFSSHDVTAYVFGEAFSAIDSLEIIAEVDTDAAVRAVTEAYPGYDLIYLDCGDNAPCAQFNVDSLTIDPDPASDPESPVCGMGHWFGKKPYFHW